MRYFLVVVVCLLLYFPADSQTFYIVRHAEKQQVSAGPVMFTPNDPPLSEEGRKRALRLKDLLKNKHISYIFSTNTIRTRSTAKPLSELTGARPIIYDTVNILVQRLKKLKKNALVVGHSDTIDDITNALAGKTVVKGNIPDKEYDNLFVVKRAGKKTTVKQMKY